ncbi:MAG: menaquinone biosynthetic enzyme MqnA/MqnD family protein [Chitinophagaceae bacterium]
MKKIKVGAVSYLNTKPLLYGVKRSQLLMQQIELIEDYPSKIAAMLVNSEIDIGLVPVAVIPQLKEWKIVTDYCIGTDGEVASVCLFSEVPIEKIEKVLLDYQSKTSVNLAKILLKKYWKINPEYENTKQDFKKRIKGTTAAVIIGDRALQQRKISPYIYDLGSAWKAFTGLPFVFAAWVSNKKLPENFIDLFNIANGIGVNNIEVVIAENNDSIFDLHSYYSKHISFQLTRQKLKGMNLFLELLRSDV